MLTDATRPDVDSLHDDHDHSSPVPLVIDLDGTLVRSDLLIETAVAFGTSSANQLFEAVKSLWKGRAQLKQQLANGSITFASLPFDPIVLGRARAAASAGIPVYVASAGDEKLVRAVAEHLGCFAGWFASDGKTNLAGAAKARRLVDVFGHGGFDYIGNDAADLAVWAVCRKRAAIRTSARVRRRLLAMDPSAEILPEERLTVRSWMRLLRVHQYVKNVLVLVPLLTSHEFTFLAIARSIGAMIAFSICASSVYILNDVIDLEADRAHPTKRTRPLACGEFPLSFGLVLVPVLLFIAFSLGAVISVPFLFTLCCYFALTSAYTFFLKRKVIVDVIVLALLYTIRVIAGAVAIDVSVSKWLLGFSLFIFVALALTKRYVEISQLARHSLPAPKNRNYSASDLPIVGSLAAASAFNGITLFALYLSSDTASRLYRHPDLLWLICPILLYWACRVLIMAHRGAMHDDPVVFALRDRISWIIVAAIVAIVLVAI